MVQQFKRIWKRWPTRARRVVHQATSWTGVPYVISFVVKYSATQSARNFAGNLPDLKAAYRHASREDRETLANRISDLANALVLPNGVRRTTYQARTTEILTAVLENERCRIDKSAVRVLDIPSANGIASLGSLDTLSTRYRVARYVMGDLLTRTLYDRGHDCIYDDAHNLLQVRRGKRFFSIYRAHKSGEPYGRVAKALLFPVELISRRLKRRYPFSRAKNVTPILMVHPEVEARLGDGVLELKTMNVFEPIDGTYDIIISFNLLQRNYFPPDVVARGRDNLSSALAEGGLLIMGSPDAGGVSPYRVYRKTGRGLEVVAERGDF